MRLNSNKINYVLDHFSRMYHDFDISSYDIGYSTENKIQIFDSEIQYDSPIDKPNFFSWKDKKLPDFYGVKSEELLVELDNKILINVDLLKHAFLFLSGIIDLKLNNNRDEIGRYLYEGSFHKRYNLLDFPVVNYYFNILEAAIEKAYNIRLTPKYKNMTTAVSHDIDKCDSGWLEDGYYLLKKGKLIEFFKLQVQKWIFNKDIWFNLDSIIDLEQKKNIVSTFFFLTRKGKYKQHTNADYSYKSRKLRKVYKHIIEANSEVGLHGSFGSAFNKQQFVNECKELLSVLPNKQLLANRFHFLCWDQTKTPKIIQDSLVSCDMSAAYPDKPGFKTGFCFPSAYYNFTEDKPYNFYEVPLILMDSTVYDNKYLGLKETEALSIANKHIFECDKFNGIYSLLWHNTYYTDLKYKGKQDLLWQIIDSCKTNKSNFFTLNKIIEEWQKD